MAGTISTMDKALKNLYLPRLRSTINTATVLSSRLEKNTTSTGVSGRKAIVPINIRGSEAIGARGDDATLPTPQNQTYLETEVVYKYLYGTLRITHPTIAASKNEEGSWVKVISAEMEGLTRDLKNDVNRQYFGDGSGALAELAGSSPLDDSNDKITLDSTLGYSQLKKNMLIDVFAAKTGGSVLSHADGLKITAIDTTNHKITVTNADGSGASLAWSSPEDDIIFRHGSRGLELMGLRGIVDDGTYVDVFQGITRSTDTEWKSQVNANGGTNRALTAQMLDDFILEVEDKGEAAITCAVTDRTRFRQIASFMTDNRRYSDQLELQGGFKSISWGDIPIFWDRDCPLDANGGGEIYFLDENEIQRYQLEDWSFDDTDGNVLHRNEGKASYDATLYYYGNLGCMAPDNQGVIRDLS